jgi:membrane protein implicated in regulation of membrane protease activity
MIWLVAGAALLVAEAPVPGVFLMWFGLAALGTGAVTLLAHLSIHAEVVLFGVLAAVAVAMGWRLRRPRAGHAPVNLPQSGLVGRTATALAFAGREGRVRLGDSDWPARLADAAEPADVPPGTRLRVVGLDGVVLLVVAG